MSVTRYVQRDSRRESRDPYRTEPNLTGPTAFFVAELGIMASSYVRPEQSDAMMALRARWSA